MVASLRGSMGTGTKKDESSTAHIWATGFHHVTTHSCLVHVLKPINCLFNFVSGRGKQQITETADNETADMGACLYSLLVPHSCVKPI